MVELGFADIANDVALVIITALELLGEHHGRLPPNKAARMNELLAAMTIARRQELVIGLLLPEAEAAELYHHGYMEDDPRPQPPR